VSRRDGNVPEADDPAVMLWSGGKDSMLALHHARACGCTVTSLLNLYDGDSGHVRFHGVRRELVAAQARALGLPLLQLPLGATDYEEVLLDGLRSARDAGATAAVFGNIHLADVRAWYEERTALLGLRHVEPLWGMQPAGVVREVVALGYLARITGVDASRGSAAWLGRDLDEELLQEIEAAGIDAAGESGEYHTFAWAGPAFHAPLQPLAADTRREGDYLLLDLRLAGVNGSGGHG
jgi:diphthine-ammonia ligase